MSKNVNPSENEDKSQASPRQPRITHRAIMPDLSPDFFNNLLAESDSIQRYAIQNQRYFEELTKTTDFFSSLNLHVMPELLKIIETQHRLVDLNTILSSPVLELATTVNQSIERLLAVDTVHIDEMLKQSAFQSQIWIEQQQALDRIVEGLRLYDMVWRSHFIDISKFAILSQTALSQISWDQLGNALEIRDFTRTKLQRAFLNFSQSYSRLFDLLDKQPSIIVSLPPVIFKLPAVEFFNGVIVVDKITIRKEEDTEFEEERQQATEGTRKETADRLEILLTELNAELLIPLHGARESLTSANPDRIRHFTISLRELFTQVLHTLASDDKVKGWSNLPAHYDDKGRPTRKARLLYICRVLNHAPFSTFIEKDVDAVVAFLQLFQQGTHEVTSKYTDFQLRIMLVWMESALRFILEIWNAS